MGARGAGRAWDARREAQGVGREGAGRSSEGRVCCVCVYVCVYVCVCVCVGLFVRGLGRAGQGGGERRAASARSATKRGDGGVHGGSVHRAAALAYWEKRELSLSVVCEFCPYHAHTCTSRYVSIRPFSFFHTIRDTDKRASERDGEISLIWQRGTARPARACMMCTETTSIARSSRLPLVVHDNMHNQMRCRFRSANPACVSQTPPPGGVFVFMAT